MSWKTELIVSLNKLKDRPLGHDAIFIGLTGSPRDFILLLPHVLNVNSHSIAWAGPGFLKLEQLTLEDDSSWIVFELSPDRRFNELIVEDVFTGQIGKVALPVYDAVDFMSL